MVEVTWSPLPYADDETKLHRGYYAGLIFRGSGFSPGITWAARRKGEDSSFAATTWTLTSIYFGDYLEVSTGDDPLEAPLSWRGYEFAVRNPGGQVSAWVEFTYPFDLDKVRETLDRSAADGRRLRAEGKHAAAVEPLRKAMVFSDRLLGQDDAESVALRQEWNDALDAAARSKFRFKVGDKVRITSGEFAGHIGTITTTRLRHLAAYVVTADDGTECQLRDNEVEPL